MTQNETDGIKQMIEDKVSGHKSKVESEKIKTKNIEKKVADEVVKKVNDEENLDVEETLNEIRKKLKNVNQKEKVQTRTDILYNLHKKIIKQREEIQAKGEIEKEEKDLSQCTFWPKTKGINSNFSKQVDIQMKNTANDNYVEKKKKQREKQNQLKDQSKFKIGTGNNWTKDLTVPKDFEFKTQGNTIPSNLNNSEIKDNATDKNIKELIDLNKTEGLKIHQHMRYDDAINYLHNILHKIKI